MPTGTTGAIRQGRAFIELFTDDTKLKQGLRLAENTLKKFGASVSKAGLGLMGAGAAILAPLGLAVREYAKAGAELKEMSERTGVAVETLSELKYVASQTGASMEDLEKGIRLSQKVMGSAVGAKMLAGLGIDAAKLKALSPEQQFIALAEAVSQIPNQVDRASAAMKIFGKGGASLLPMLMEGRDGINRLREEARKLGLVMTDEDATAAHEFDNSMQRVRQQVMRLVGSVGASLVPALNDFGQWLSRAIPQVRTFVDEHRGWIVMAAKAALAAVGLGVALFAVGKIIAGVSLAFAAMRTVVVVVSGLWSVLAGGRAVIAFVTGALQGLKIALIAGRTAVLGLATASGLAQAVTALWPALLIGAFIAVMHFAGGFKELGRVFGVVMGGIGDAIATGDIQAAMSILWAGIKVIWSEGINWIVKAFYGLNPVLARVLATLATTMLTGWMVMKKGAHDFEHSLTAPIADKATKFALAYVMAGVDKDVKAGRMTPEAGAAKKDKLTAAYKGGKAQVDADFAAQQAKDQEDIDAAAAGMVSAVEGFYKSNAEIFAELDAKSQKQWDELNALRGAVKDKRITQDLRDFFDAIDKPRGGPPGGADIAGAQSRADAVVGGFDIGARMSFQASGESSTLERIAVAAEATAENTKDGAESGYGA